MSDRTDDERALACCANPAAPAAEVEASAWIREGGAGVEVAASGAVGSVDAAISEIAEHLSDAAEVLVIMWMKGGGARIELTPRSTGLLLARRATLTLVLHHESDEVFASRVSLSDLEARLVACPVESALVARPGGVDTRIIVTEARDSQAMLGDAIQHVDIAGSTVTLHMHARARGVELFLAAADLDILTRYETTLHVHATAACPRISNHDGRLAIAMPVHHTCEPMAVALEDGDLPSGWSDSVAIGIDCSFCGELVTNSMGAASGFVPAVPGRPGDPPVGSAPTVTQGEQELQLMDGRAE